MTENVEPKSGDKGTSGPKALAFVYEVRKVEAVQKVACFISKGVHVEFVRVVDTTYIRHAKACTGECPRYLGKLIDLDGKESLEPLDRIVIEAADAFKP